MIFKFNLCFSNNHESASPGMVIHVNSSIDFLLAHVEGFEVFKLRTQAFLYEIMFELPMLQCSIAGTMTIIIAKILCEAQCVIQILRD